MNEDNFIVTNIYTMIWANVTLGNLARASFLLFIPVLFLAVQYWRLILIQLTTLPRDIKFVVRWAKLILKTRNFVKNNTTVVSIFKSRVLERPDDVIFYYEDTVWTNGDIYEYSNQVANVFYEAGYRHGNVVALCMENRPEYVAIWLGLAKLGVIAALINTNQHHGPLLHSLKVVSPKGIIFTKDLEYLFSDITKSLDPSIKMYRFGSQDSSSSLNNVQDLQKLITRASVLPPKNIQAVKNKDILFYIYTSGTTGLPKAAIIPHARYLIVTLATTTIISLNKDDIMYNPLPLYHSAGGIIGTGPALVAGIPIVIRSKFSASSYITDCIKYKCTLAQYIGEMCRYILATPEKPTDKEHKLRMLIGNGMSSSIWQEFVDRFKIPQVTELYGATEGNVNIVNLDSTVGAVGFLPRFLPQSLVGIGIIKINDETLEPLRDRKGLCIMCDINEPGMFVGIISSRNASREFHGYVDKKESAKKTIQNVFTLGDKGFVSGDIMVMDDYGYLYFKDRTGDTYRWKGENVSTSEVEAAISKVANFLDATVYGVAIPGQDGKAGMATIADPDNLLVVEELKSNLDKALPGYAVPLIVRITKTMDKTSTFRLKKFGLQGEGFDPSKINDPLFFNKGNGYVPLTPKMYQEIVTGQTRL